MKTPAPIDPTLAEIVKALARASINRLDEPRRTRSRLNAEEDQRKLVEGIAMRADLRERAALGDRAAARALIVERIAEGEISGADAMIELDKLSDDVGLFAEAMAGAWQ